MRQRREVVDGHLHARNAILLAQVREMHLRRHILSKISIAECIQRVLKEDDRSHEANETVIFEPFHIRYCISHHEAT
jgi:hypothetical protein